MKPTVSLGNTYKIVVYVPAPHIDNVKEALFNAGAGQQGHYERCCWQVLGEGQFLPLSGSKPFIGQESLLRGTIETVAEYRLEILCEELYLERAIAALVQAHPYEEPAFDIIQRHVLER